MQQPMITIFCMFIYNNFCMYIYIYIWCMYILLILVSLFESIWSYGNGMSWYIVRRTVFIKSTDSWTQKCGTNQRRCAASNMNHSRTSKIFKGQTRTWKRKILTKDVLNTFSKDRFHLLIVSRIKEIGDVTLQFAALFSISVVGNKGKMRLSRNIP